MPEPRDDPAKDVNIRIDATITESRAEPLGRQVISVTLRGGDSGSVRSSALVPQPKFGGPPDAQGTLTRAPLNMDATVFLRDSGRVLARVTLEYNRGSVEIGDSGGQRAAFDSGIRQSVSVMLENGKPLVVAFGLAHTTRGDICLLDLAAAHGARRAGRAARAPHRGHRPQVRALSRGRFRPGISWYSHAMRCRMAGGSRCISAP